MGGCQKVQVNYIGASVNHVYSLPLTPGERERKQGRNGTEQLKLGAGGQRLRAGDVGYQGRII